MVRRTIIAGESRAVHAEDDRELLQADVVDDRVEGALEKRRVDGADRLVSLGGEASREDDRMLFGNTDVEVAFRMMRPEKIEGGAIGHGRGNGDDLLIVVGELHKGVGENFGVSDLACGLGVPGFRIVGSEAMELLLLIEGGLVALPLLGENVQQDGPVLGLEEVEGLDEQGEIMAVDRAIVFEPEFLEKHGGPKHSLGGFLSLAGDLGDGLASEALQQASG